VTGGDVETSWLGIGLTIATLAICQPLGLAKRRLGARLGSLATVGEGTQNLLCGYMAVAVRSARQHPVWHLVAGSDRGPRHRRRRRAGGTQGIARRGLRMRDLLSDREPNWPAADR
jgi:hypothetical protein